MPFTFDDLKQFQTNQRKAASKRKNPIVECGAEHEPLAKNQVETSDSGKRLVVVESFRRRLLDEDNLSCKFHIDALRYAGVLSGDAPHQTTIRVTQTKVAKKEDERTEITITKLWLPRLRFTRHFHK